MDHIEQIRQLCLANQVKTLFAFGSIVTEKFSEDSDIDLVVDIAEKDPFLYSDKYFQIKYDLIDILGRKIDLLEEGAISNPYFKEELERTKVLIYAP
jgi:hypothetical protein